MSEVPSVAYESRGVCYCEAYRFLGDLLEHGPARCTAFFWTEGDSLFLITNWHNVTGLRPDTRKPIGSFAPTHLEFTCRENVHRLDDESHFTQSSKFRISLYDHGFPIWLEHPVRSECDVVAIPLHGLDWKGRILPINSKMQYDHYNPEVGDDCFIVGYPEGLSGPIDTPIWKRGSIATEPDLPYREMPAFLVDSATRKGMSGAPVFARFHGLWGRDGKPLDYQKAPILGHWTKFLGVYSGREGVEQDGFQLGRVWHASVVPEIIAGNLKGEHPHF